MTGSADTVQELISHMDTGGLINFLRPPSGGEQRQHDLMGRRREGRKARRGGGTEKKNSKQNGRKEKHIHFGMGGRNAEKRKERNRMRQKALTIL